MRREKREKVATGRRLVDGNCRRNPLDSWQVFVDELDDDLSFDRHFIGFTQLYNTDSSQGIMAEYEFLVLDPQYPDSHINTVLEVIEGGTQHNKKKSLFLVYMRGRAGYIYKYIKNLGINNNKVVYLLFYL